MTTPPGPPPLPEPASRTPPSEAPSTDPQEPVSQAGETRPPYGSPAGYGPPPSAPPPSAPPPSGAPPSAPPPGYGPPEGYPPAGYGTPPPYGYGNAPGYPPYQPGPKPGTDGFAIASLVTGILGGVLLSVVFGFVALSRIKRSGQGGRGLAIAGLVLSGVWVLVIAVAVAAAVLAGPSRDTTGAVRKPASIDVGDLKTGDCLVTIPADTSAVSEVDATPCTTAHRAEVFATFELPSGGYPGVTQARKLADDGCNERTPTITSTAGGKLELYYVYPQKSSWSLGDRSVTCFVAMAQPVTSKIVP